MTTALKPETIETAATAPRETSTPSVQDEVKAQAGKLLTQFAGFVGFKTIKMGLDSGLLTTLSEHPEGLTAGELSEHTSANEFYAGVWARAAYAAELIDVDAEGRYTLAPHMDKLLLDVDSPGYVGGIPGVFSEPEVFDNFAGNLKNGNRIWWDDASPEFIQAVAGTGRPFYNRLIPTGLERVPGLVEKLERGGRVLELANGAGVGLVKFAQAFPNTEIIGVDGDAHSIDLAWQRANREGVADRVSLVQSPLEDFVEEDAYDLVFINISMHECRDIDLVTENVRRSLKLGGVFVISDFPFPDTHEGLRNPAARVLTGIQYFEAQIDDQLLPTAVFVDLLDRHGFTDVNAEDITPVHNLIYGRK